MERLSNRFTDHSTNRAQDAQSSNPGITICNAKKTWKSAFSWAFQIFEMVGRVGFEPTTNWLKANWLLLTKKAAHSDGVLIGSRSL
ncbi:hypothetical protein [Pseudomonas amygdali]|uniref:hypothetical protein n=1 Tax=Pseudomonas amygdali TaxID=47877 RepID=UPI000708C883|nr:hypothetical protein [Pseudomonas amygdali]